MIGAEKRINVNQPFFDVVRIDPRAIGTGTKVKPVLDLILGICPTSTCPAWDYGSDGPS